MPFIQQGALFSFRGAHAAAQVLCNNLHPPRQAGRLPAHGPARAQPITVQRLCSVHHVQHKIEMEHIRYLNVILLLRPCAWHRTKVALSQQYVIGNGYKDELQGRVITSKWQWPLKILSVHEQEYYVTNGIQTSILCTDLIQQTEAG